MNIRRAGVEDAELIADWLFDQSKPVSLPAFKKQSAPKTAKEGKKGKKKGRKPTPLPPECQNCNDCQMCQDGACVRDPALVVREAFARLLEAEGLSKPVGRRPHVLVRDHRSGRRHG